MTEPLPVQVVIRGPITARDLDMLATEERLCLAFTETLSPITISLASRMSGVLVIAGAHPLDDLAYAITAKLRLPIAVAVSGTVRVDDGDILAAGAAECVRLPLDAAQFECLIACFARENHSVEAHSQLKVRLDAVSRPLHHGTGSVKLSQREVALLHFMLRQGEQLVASHELLTYVWGNAASRPETRQMLDVYICRLRKKLSELDVQGEIRTLRGYGYALVPFSGSSTKRKLHAP